MYLRVRIVTVRRVTGRVPFRIIVTVTVRVSDYGKNNRRRPQASVPFCLILVFGIGDCVLSTRSRQEVLVEASGPDHRLNPEPPAAPLQRVKVISIDRVEDNRPVAGNHLNKCSLGEVPFAVRENPRRRRRQSAAPRKRVRRDHSSPLIVEPQEQVEFSVHQALGHDRLLGTAGRHRNHYFVVRVIDGLIQDNTQTDPRGILSWFGRCHSLVQPKHREEYQDTDGPN